MIATLAALSLALVGCKNESDIMRLTHTDTFNPEGTDSADILFVVDNSISMANEQDLVANGFDRFIGAVGETDVDFHIGVVNTDMDVQNWERGVLIGSPPYLTPSDPYIPLFMERVRVGTDGSDKERGLMAADYALRDPDTAEANAGFLRGDDAVLAIVFVSDENDCSDDNRLTDATEGAECYHTDKLTSVVDYIKGYRAVKGPKGRVVVSGIVGPAAAEGCEGSWPGTRYWTVIDQLDGMVGDICDADYGDVMDDIGARISGPMRIFTLTYQAVEGTVEVRVDEEVVEESATQGWTYDAEYNTVRFDGSYYPEFGTEVEIEYEIAGQNQTEE